MMHSCVMRQEADLVTVGGGVVEGERREQIFFGETPFPQMISWQGERVIPICLNTV